MYPCGIFDAMVRPDIQLFHRVDEFGAEEYDEPGRHHGELQPSMCSARA